MKNLYIKILGTVFFCLFRSVSCDDFVDEIDPLVNEIADYAT